MTIKITVTLQADDAEPYLRQAAEDAAKFGAWVDHITRKTYNAPSRDRPRGESFEECRKGWQTKFLRAKRIVEAFGVEYEPTSEAETLTVDYDWIGGTTKVVDFGSTLGKVGMRSGSQPDFKHPKPAYFRSAHPEACRQAASRVVRRWRAQIGAQVAA